MTAQLQTAQVEGAAAQAFAECDATLRREDPDRWLASLFAPAEKRPFIHALHAFSLEIARAPELVSEPVMGQIRLQWWRDAILAPERDDARANPVALALNTAVARFELPRETLIALIDAREFDLFDETFPDVAALEAYARATSSSLFELSARILAPGSGAGRPDVAGHAGAAYALTGLLRAFAWNAARGRLHAPQDILDARRLARAEALSGRKPAALAAALADLRALARAHLDVFAARLDGEPEAVRPAYLPLSLCRPYLRLMEKKGYDPFTSPVALPQWRRQWILFRAARRWS